MQLLRPAATALSRLSPYVHRSGNNYYHSITGDLVSGDDPCPPHFLEGSEREVLTRRLLQPPEELRLLVVATWGCNLRCPHCYVLHELQKPEAAKPLDDIDGVKFFVESHRSRYGELPLYISMLGGEALLADNECTRLVHALGDMAVHVDMTTNLSVEMSEGRIELLRSLHSFCVSIDGDKDNHDAQRRSPWSSRSPYEATMENLAILQKEGLTDKISVQATLAEDFLMDQERCIDFIAQLLTLGVSRDNIKIGCIAPNKSREAGELWQRARINPEVRRRPCCSYRYMNNFVITPDGVHVDYFNKVKLGDFRDDIDGIAKAYEEHILARMPILKDENCIRCPVMFMCWGSCSNGHNAKGCTRPSDGCGQAQLMGDRLREYLDELLPDPHI